MKYEEVLRSLKDLTATELRRVIDMSAQWLYAKGVEDFIHAQQHGKNLGEILAGINKKL